MTHIRPHKVSYYLNANAHNLSSLLNVLNVSERNIIFDWFGNTAACLVIFVEQWLEDDKVTNRDKVKECFIYQSTRIVKSLGSKNILYIMDAKNIGIVLTYLPDEERHYLLKSIKRNLKKIFAAGYSGDLYAIFRNKLTEEEIKDIIYNEDFLNLLITEDTFSMLRFLANLPASLLLDNKVLQSKLYNRIKLSCNDLIFILASHKSDNVNNLKLIYLIENYQLYTEPAVKSFITLLKKCNKDETVIEKLCNKFNVIVKKKELEKLWSKIIATPVCAIILESSSKKAKLKSTYLITNSIFVSKEYESVESSEKSFAELSEESYETSSEESESERADEFKII